MTNGREMTPPPGFSTPPHIPNINTTERPPVTTTVFAATTPGNTPFAYRDSTSTDPAPMISPAFVKANNEILESLLRDRQRQIRNKDLRTELEYFSEDYDEELEMEPRPERTREVTPPLRTRSPRVCRQRERVVGFKEAPNRERSRIGRNIEGNRPSEAGAEENGRWEMNLPPLLATHLGRNEDGQPPRSSLTFVHGGRQSSINTGGNLPPNGTLFSHHAQPFIPTSVLVPNGFVPTHITPYSQPSAAIINGQTPHLRLVIPSLGEPLPYPPQGGYVPQTFPNDNIPLYNGSAYPVPAPMNNYPFHTQPMYAQPKMPVCPNLYPVGLFADPTGSVTPFVRWIEDYPLPDGLKMPSHVGSYDGRGILIISYTSSREPFVALDLYSDTFSAITLIISHFTSKATHVTISAALLQILGCYRWKDLTWIEARESHTNELQRLEDYTSKGQGILLGNGREQRSKVRLSHYGDLISGCAL
ncbi:hypothetical protein Tco_1220105 [Tanacetum coccineum]